MFRLLPLVSIPRAGLRPARPPRGSKKHLGLPGVFLMSVLASLSALPSLAAEAGHQHPPAKPLEQRKAIALNAEEAAHIRLEMRLFLSGVQKIVTGAAHNDMKVVAEAATEALAWPPPTRFPQACAQKLPLEFKKLGHATHTGFDDLARDAASMADPNLAMKQLGQVMSNCVSCHAAFRIEPAPRKR
jgi:cytochrome c556